MGGRQRPREYGVEDLPVLLWDGSVVEGLCEFVGAGVFLEELFPACGGFGRIGLGVELGGLDEVLACDQGVGLSGRKALEALGLL